MTSYEKFTAMLESTGERVFTVSKATGIPPSTFSDWKSGKSLPKTEKLAKIAKHFGVSVAYFLDDDVLSAVDFALWGEVRTLTEEEKQDVFDYIMFKKSKNDRT